MPAGSGGEVRCPGAAPRSAAAEVLGVVRGAVGGVHDADGERLGATVEQVATVARALHPRVDDLGGAAVAPGDVLAAGGGVAGGRGAGDEGGSGGAGVAE